MRLNGRLVILERSWMGIAVAYEYPLTVGHTRVDQVDRE